MAAALLLLSLILLPGLSSSLTCSGQYKCYGRGYSSSTFIYCDSRACTSKGWKWNEPACGSDGYPLPTGDCTADWFHGECRCIDTPFDGSYRNGKDRCECDLDPRTVGAVAGLAAVAVLAMIVAACYCKRFRRMKKVAAEAKIEVRVVNRQLELVTRAPESNPGTGKIAASAPQQSIDYPPPDYSESYINPGNTYEELDEINIG